MMNVKSILSIIFIFLGMMFFSAQENYNTLVHKGNQAFKKGKFDNASSKYMEAAKMKEKDFTAHYNLGNALYKRKMYEEAKAEFEKAEKLSKNNSDKSAALYNLGNANMQTNNSEKAAELYKKALKQDPYNEAIRKNYEIAKLKEKEKQQQDQKNDSDKEGEDQKKDQEKGQYQQQQDNTPKQEQGNGQKNKGEGEGENRNQNKGEDADKMPKDLQDAILNRVENKERETAKKILNKNSFSMPQSNEKDW